MEHKVSLVSESGSREDWVYKEEMSARECWALSKLVHISRPKLPSHCNLILACGCKQWGALLRTQQRPKSCEGA